ncbi:MAG: hypothetical protein RIM84_26585 [Alphaproteobacteria bacterium]
MHRRLLLAAGIYLLVLLGGAVAGFYLSDVGVIDVRPANEPDVHRMVVSAAALYVVTAAMPFVPGAEIGLGLIVTLGSRIVPLVYLGMVCALLLAFAVGRFVPLRFIVAVLARLRLRRGRELLDRLARLPPDQRANYLAEQMPTGTPAFLLRHRYLLLAVAFNMPGNSIIGGGGGLALAAGISGLYGVVPFVATVAVAVSPLPLMVLIGGYLPGG